MKLYRAATTRTTSKLATQLKKASGNIKGHYPHGFASVLGFSFGDIYVTNELFVLLNTDTCREIDKCLQKMLKQDYGTVDNETKNSNCENRYFGNGKNILGKYKISVGHIEISILNTHTLIKLLSQ